MKIVCIARGTAKLLPGCGATPEPFSSLLTLLINKDSALCFFFDVLNFIFLLWLILCSCYLQLVLVIISVCVLLLLVAFLDVHSCCSSIFSFCALLVFVNLSLRSYCSSTPPYCALLLLVRTSLLCSIIACQDSLLYMLVLVNVSMVCSICVHWLLLIMFYQCSLAHPCCALLVLANVSLLCSIGGHQHVLAMLYWCLLTPPCYALLLFIGTSLLHFLTCDASCTFLMIVFNGVFCLCSMSFQSGTFPLHFCVQMCVGVKEKNFNFLFNCKVFLNFFSRVCFFEVFHFLIFCSLHLFSNVCFQSISVFVFILIRHVFKKVVII